MHINQLKSQKRVVLTDNEKVQVLNMKGFDDTYKSSSHKEWRYFAAAKNS
jgi:hypothetical protein